MSLLKNKNKKRADSSCNIIVRSRGPLHRSEHFPSE